jgi:hypothetical protein
MTPTQTTKPQSFEGQSQLLPVAGIHQMRKGFLKSKTDLLLEHHRSAELMDCVADFLLKSGVQTDGNVVRDVIHARH